MAGTTPNVRWGIISTADIAGKAFIPAVRESAGGQIVAVGSRTREKAAQFAARHEIPRAYGSYDAVLEDPEVEAVYIGLPNTMHAEWIARAAAAGKHVFCEKPMTMTVAEAEASVAACRKAGVLLVEAFVFRFHRQARVIRRLLDEGAIGPVRHADAHFHYAFAGDPSNIRLRPEVGGGALMDVGCYALHWARFVMGEAPESVAAQAVPHPSGVDATTTAILRFSGGRTANISVGLSMQGGQGGRAYGAQGVLEATMPFHPRPGARVYVRRGNNTEDHSVESMPQYPFTDAVTAFQAAVRGEAPLPFDTMADILAQARTVVATRTAAAEGRWVSLAEALA